MNLKKILFPALILFTTFANANAKIENSDNRIINFIKSSTNKDVQLDYVRIKARYNELQNNWLAYLVEIKVKNDTKIYEEIFFSDGYYISQGLINLETLENVRNIAIENFTKKLDETFYKRENLIFGNLDSKNKLVVFSDPLCPYCIDFFNELNENLDKLNDVAIFYYMFPLKERHPNSDILLKASLFYKIKNNKSIDLELYKALSKQDLYEKAMKSKISALELFNELFNTKYTLDEIDRNKVLENMLNQDIEKANMQNIKGTPNVFLNGMIDIERSKIFKLKEKQ